ncbi:LuxR C-terminal-related transcriptional regulator [Nocardioides scoriae]|uniref:LuxR C-terminal-related transcriptional regulator n=1 Tax=Nocardioides scoriae TaxID=642780 RepID=UPI0015612213|nr:response regulator transcription factor [Nocardioides scoriae]
MLHDAHDIFRRGVAAVLLDDPSTDLVRETSSFAELAELPDDVHAHVALVGVRAFELDELEVLSRLRVRHPWLRVLVMTTEESPEVLESSRVAGADALISKSVSAEHLIAAARSMVDGRPPADPEHRVRIVAQATGAEVEARAAAEPGPRLTRQEQRILELLARGLTNRQIAETLTLQEKTVRNHVTAVLAKLGVERRTQAALLAVRTGLTTVD